MEKGTMNEATSLFKAPAYQLRGVRGWLLLFCIGCLVGFLQALGNALDSHHWFHVLCWATLAALEISCCTLLWLKSPRGLNILYLLFAASLIDLAYVLIQGIRALLSSQGNIAIMYLSSCVIGSLLLFAWYRYFKESERVRNTYGRNL